MRKPAHPSSLLNAEDGELASISEKGPATICSTTANKRRFDNSSDYVSRQDSRDLAA